MRVIVSHHLWSRVGGGELVNAYVVKTFLRNGYKVAIASTFGFDKSEYDRWFGIKLEDVPTYYLFKKMFPAFGIYQRLGTYIPLSRAIRNLKPNLVWIDSELYRPILKLKNELEFKLIEYIHFPFDALRFERREVPKELLDAFERYMSEAIEYMKKYKKGLWRFYFKFWLKLYEKVARKNPFESADIVLTNSKYIARLVKMLWNDNATVLNPPVKVEEFKPYASKPFEKREDRVIMIGRIFPEKRVETIIDAIAISETKPKLTVVGGLIPTTMPYLNLLRKRAVKKKVKLEVYPNVNRDTLIKLATSSKIFAHGCIGEHFGIAVVEAMASGTPVIVHRSGGPYEDIIDRGKYGLFYETVEELAEEIDELITDDKKWNKFHELSIRRAEEYGEKAFSDKLFDVINKLI